MITHAETTKETESRSFSSGGHESLQHDESTYQIADNKSGTQSRQKLQAAANNNNRNKRAAQLQAMADRHSTKPNATVPIQREENEAAASSSSSSSSTENSQDAQASSSDGQTESAAIPLGADHIFKVEINDFNIEIKISNMLGVPAASLGPDGEEKWDSISFNLDATNKKYRKKWKVLIGDVTFKDIINKGETPLSQQNWPVALEQVVHGIVQKGEQTYASLQPIMGRLEEVEKMKDQGSEQASEVLGDVTKSKKTQAAKVAWAGYRGGADAASSKAQSIASDRLDKAKQKIPGSERVEEALGQLSPAIEAARSEGLDSGLELAVQASKDGTLKGLGDDGAIQAQKAMAALSKSHKELMDIAADLSGNWLGALLENAIPEITIDNTYYNLVVRKPHLVGASTVELSRSEGEAGESDRMALNSHVDEKIDNKKEQIELHSSWQADDVARTELDLSRKTQEGRTTTEQTATYLSPEAGMESGSFSSESTTKGSINRLKTKAHTKTAGSFRLAKTEDGTTDFAFSGESEDKKMGRRAIDVSKEGLSYEGYKSEDAAIALNQASVTEEGLSIQASFNKSKISRTKRAVFWALCKKAGVDHKLVPKNVDLQLIAPVEDSDWVNLVDLSATAEGFPLLDGLLNTELAKLHVDSDDAGANALYFNSIAIQIPSDSLEAPTESAPRGRVNIKAIIAYVVDQGLDTIASQWGESVDEAG